MFTHVVIIKTYVKRFPTFSDVFGRFKKGQPEGKGHIVYKDGSTLHGHFVNGRINGKVRLFTDKNKLLGVGLYQQGLPHGPFWIYSYHQEQFAQVRIDIGSSINDVNPREENFVNMGVTLFIDNPITITIWWPVAW